MRRTLWILALCAALAGAAAVPASALAADRYLLVLEEEKVSSDQIEELVASLGGTVYRDLSEIGLAIVTSDDANFQRRLRQAPGVMDVTFDGKRETTWSRNLERMRQSLTTAGVDDLQQLRQAPAPAPAPRSDFHGGGGPGSSLPDITTLPFWFLQWNMDIMGVDEAQNDLGYYGDRVQVAVLGAGIDYTHVELAGRVNLDLSKSFVPSDDALVEALFPGAHPIADLAFHTTHNASLISCTFSFFGCIAPESELIGIKVLDKDEFGTIGDVVSGIKYAGDIRADVAVMPWSMWGPSYPQWNKIWNLGNPEDRADVRAVKRAIRYAKWRGVSVIADSSTPFFDLGIDADADGRDVILPAQAGALTVACSGSQDTWCKISNYGYSLIDIAAPGGWVDSSTVPPTLPATENVWGACSAFSQFGTLPQSCAAAVQPQWLIVVGPQTASVHAAGAAALIDSKYHGWLPGWLINAWMKATAVDIEDPGFDPFTGHGRVDLVNALGGH